MSGPAYGTYAALTVTNLQSLASDSSDPFTAWQSAIVDNRTTLALDYDVRFHIPMAATAPGGDGFAYIYVIPWIHDGTSWQPGANFGTTTQPTGSEGTASISEPNSMKLALTVPYKVTSQPLDGEFSLCAALNVTSPPAGFSFVARDNTGAAFSTGCIFSVQPKTVS